MPPKQASVPPLDPNTNELSSQLLAAINHAFENQVAPLKEELKAMKDASSKMGHVGSRMDSLEAMLGRFLHFHEKQPEASVPPPHIPNRGTGMGHDKKVPSASRGILDTPIFSDRPPSPPEEDKRGKYGKFTDTNFQGHRITLPKLDFPSFNGTEILTWVEDSEFYFEVFQIPEIYKTRLAITHFQGDARSWYRGFIINKPDPPWPVLVEEVKARFTIDGSDNPLELFRKVVHTGSIDEYIRSFERMKSRLTSATQIQSEDFYLFGFLSGLRAELKYTVEMCQPINLTQAYKLARQAELSLQGQEQRGKWVAKPVIPFSPRLDKPKDFPDRKLLPPPPPKQTLPPTSFSNLSRDQMRQLGLCFYCGEKYNRDHKCQKRKLLLLEAIDSWGSESSDIQQSAEPIIDDTYTEEGYEHADISMCSPHDKHNSQTLKFKGVIQQLPIMALIDSGSTHSFLHPAVVTLLQLPTIPSPPMMVKTASGSKLLSNMRCEALTFSLQQHEFQATLRILEVQGYDLILGMDWITQMGPMLIDGAKGMVQLTCGGTTIKLQVQNEMAELKLCDGSINVSQELHKGNEVIVAQLFTTWVGPLSDTNAQPQKVIPQELQQVVSTYSNVFADPTSLPPERLLDHHIQLKPDAQPINIRPYRFSHFQKLEIEKIVEELLQSGYVRPSTSPFASPILLVKKKDQTWRLCVDYRRLNDYTVKNKFPIPIIDDLLDELRGATIFSKIDLKSGYHQIRMAAPDIPKTTFRTHMGHYEFTVMPFGLTNAQATFQALMNSIFKPYLRKFLLVFFDDILIYSSSMSEHAIHLTLTLQLLQQHQLFAKLSKCEIDTPTVEYIGHIISAEGVATDPAKIEAMVSWPIPKTVKQLRGFLGLTGYYRKFIQSYGLISRPLTDLLKKDAFKWNSEAQLAFTELKAAMTAAPVLALPDFTKPFIIETDASQNGLGAVLMQEKRPIAFLSKALGPKNQSLSTYELLAVVTAVTKWRHYLIGGSFVIRTDHISLKHLLEQKINTSMQHKSLSKLLGLTYTIEYKKGTHNVVVDALSRRDGTSEESSELCMVSEIIPQWVTELQGSYVNDSWIVQLRKQLTEAHDRPSHLSEHQGLLRYKGRICVGETDGWRSKLLHELHNSSIGGHSGALVTYKRVKALFYWPAMRKSVMDHVRSCDICQIVKPEHVPLRGLLQPLPVPAEAWSSIGMDFITGLPKSDGKEVLLVVVDRLTKYGHFIPLAHPYSAATVAQAFLDNVYKLHGLPASIVSDRGPVFTSRFWQEIMDKLGIKLNLSTAYHPQSDGQVERVNQCVETYLRSMVFNQQKQWAKWIPLAEYWYNTNFHSSLSITPFKALYGYDPPSLPLGSAPKCTVEAVNVVLRDRQQILTDLRSQLVKAQERMKKLADIHRSEREFSKGDWVYLKLQPYRQLSVSGCQNNKLSPRFYGPYEILEKIGQVAYRLNLPVNSSIHPVIHVSQLKEKIGNGQVIFPTLPLVGLQPPVQLEPELILERRMIKRRNAAVPQILVKWLNQPHEEATWEDYTVMQHKFPHINLEDKVVVKGRGMSDAGEGIKATADKEDVCEIAEELQLEAIHCLANDVIQKAVRWIIRQ
ncbi:polyprotein [Rhynchospora pubera]|uniref:Polyprotein n=1 Tax=Rhynchospora pubera TaxID=906938 RepID=A0AAV8EKJ9_9POAL|nr:polyprotein [Rhynchospora pubera]